MQITTQSLACLAVVVALSPIAPLEVRADSYSVELPFEAVSQRGIPFAAGRSAGQTVITYKVIGTNDDETSLSGSVTIAVPPPSFLEWGEYAEDGDQSFIDEYNRVSQVSYPEWRINSNQYGDCILGTSRSAGTLSLLGYRWWIGYSFAPFSDWLDLSAYEPIDSLWAGDPQPIFTEGTEEYTGNERMLVTASSTVVLSRAVSSSSCRPAMLVCVSSIWECWAESILAKPAGPRSTMGTVKAP